MKAGGTHLVSIARSLALEVLRRVEAEGAYASLALNHALRRNPDVSPRDQALITELVYGTLRWRRRLDYILATHSSRRLEKIEPTLLRILRLTAYQLLFLDRIPAWAAVDQGTELASIIKGRRAAGFVNGVLRAIASNPEQIKRSDPSGDPVRALAINHSFPDWMAEWWVKLFGEKRSAAFMEACNQPAPLWVRTNTLRVTPDGLCSMLTALGHSTFPSDQVPGAVRLEGAGDVVKLSTHEAGLFHVQDAAAQAVCQLLDPRGGQRVLDACGAPGGKTATIAQLMGDVGEIFSADINPARVGLVRKLVSRLGISCVQTFSQDLSGELPEDWGGFDRVLLDAPCSSLGTLRRHPEGKWRLAPGDLKRLAQLQRKLLDSVSRAVKPGGSLVYSVCTFTDEEGPEQITQWLADHPEFERNDPRSGKKAPWHALIDKRGALVTWPDQHDMDGFYAVRLKRKA